MHFIAFRVYIAVVECLSGRFCAPQVRLAADHPQSFESAIVPNFLVPCTVSGSQMAAVASCACFHLTIFIYTVCSLILSLRMPERFI